MRLKQEMLLRYRLSYKLLKRGRVLCYHGHNRRNRSHVCIVGSGPAGFYAAQQVLKGNPKIHVDIYEKLPVPFGLVRYGVAPDHPEVKNVINTFTQTAQNSRCSFFGNVTVGKDITLSELKEYYTAVILAYGAEDDRLLGIPGEDFRNVVGARNFVGWYNGLPLDSNLQVDLDTDTAIILGQGNVALDVARILLTPIDILAKTDITEHSLEALRKSRIKRVLIVGRRGPLQVAFTIKELREMTKLPECKPVLIKSDFEGLANHLKDLPRPRKRLTELLYKTALESTSSNTSTQKEWGLRFRLSPLEIMGTPTRITGIKFGVNCLQGDNAVLTDKCEKIPCGLILRSIGYRGTSLDNTVPFDTGDGVIKNNKGRVDGNPGVYCTGWISRGPIGVIVTTMTDGFDVGKTVIRDIEKGVIPNTSEREGAIQTLRDRGVKTVSFEDWLKIDKAEISAGEALNKPREKIVNTDDMLKLLVN